ncbi:hypothetical protein CE91St46_11570 [Eubacteriales bacterium]|nr:hypothetical protein CE91St46_11570 [Eubacteriales bacterium]GKH62682.1 hypothetical protein CE91St47_11510 [Eubacteriales bacterium]
MEVLTTDEALKTLKGSSARPFHSDVLDTEEAIKILRAHSQVEKREPKVYTVSKPQEPRTYHRNADGLMTQVGAQPTAKQQKQAENAARLDALAGRTGAQKDLPSSIGRPQMQSYTSQREGVTMQLPQIDQWNANAAMPAVKELAGKAVNMGTNILFPLKGMKQGVDLLTGKMQSTFGPEAERQALSQMGAVQRGVERVAGGLNSIVETPAAALRYAGETAVQAGKNLAENFQKDGYGDRLSEAVYRKIKNQLTETAFDPVLLKYVSVPIGTPPGKVHEAYLKLQEEKGAEQAASAALKEITTDTPVDPNSAGSQMMQQTQERQAAAVEGLSPTGQFIGNTLASVGQNAMLMPLAAINPAVPLAGMAGMAGAGKAYEVQQAGGGAMEALARGTVAGLIEAATEKLPLDNLLKIASSPVGKKAIWNILEQMGTEATEEAVSYVANYIADAAAKDPNAEFSLKDMMLSALGGGISGGIMGAGGAVVGYARNGNTNVQAAQPAQESAFTQQAGTDAHAVQSAAQAGSAGHTPEMQRTIAEYQAAVDPGVVSYATGILQGSDNTGKAYQVGRVSERAGAELNDILGFDPSGFEISLNPASVIHINNRHGLNGNADRSMADIRDLARIGYVLENYDSVRKDPTASKAFSGRDGKGAPKVVYQKRVDGTYYVVEAVPDSKAHKVHVVSAFIEKANQQAPLATAVGSTSDNAPAGSQDLSWLPVSGLQLPEMEAKTDPINIILPQQAEGVNTSIPGSGAENDMLKKFGLDDLRPKQATAGMPEDIADLRPGKQDGRLYAVAPELREAVTGESMLDRLKSSVKPHESLTGSRLADESSIKHLGEADAFDNVKVLLEEAMDERAERKKNAEEPVAQILDSGAKKENVNLLDKLGDAKLKLVDSGAQIDKIGKALGDDVLYPLYNNAKQARQAAMYHIGKAQTDLQGRKIGKSVMEIFEPIKVQGNDYFKAFEEYLFHRHNVDSMTMKTRGAAVLQGFLDQVEAQHPELAGKSAAEVRRMRRDPAMREAANEWLALKRRQNGLKDKPVFGYSVTAEDSMRKADALQMEHPEFEQLSQDVYAYYRNQLQNEADAGLISAKERELLNQLYPHYVPVITEEMGVKPTQNGRFAGVADVHKSREGNVRNLIPIDEAMARNTLSSVAAAKRNLFGVRLLEGALSERGKVGRDVQSVYDADIPYGTDDVPRLDNEFMVWVDGSPTVMRVSNPLMEGVNSMMPKQVNKNELLELMRKGNTAFKIGVTSANPAFLVRNGIRDIQDAVTYTKDLKSFVKNYPKAYQEIMQDGEMWQLYQSMGGTGDSFFDYEKGLLNNEPKNPAGKFIAKMQSLNEMVEQAPRLAEFMSTIQKGGTGYENVQRALLDAADVTVNFGRSGELTKALNSTVVPFLNPSVQGASKFIRNLSQGNVKAWVRTIAKMSLAGLLPSLINELAFGDDEEYQMLSDSVKDNYFLFPIGDGRFFRLPKGRAGMPVGNLAIRVVRAARGQEPDMLSYLQSTIDSTAPQNPLTNNLLAALNDSQLLNSDSPGRTWYGGQIEPERLRSLKPGDRTDENTDAFSTMAGKAMGISPKKINYLLDQYTGFAGDMLLPLMTPAARESLLVSNFVTDSVMSNRLADDFYSAKDQAQQAFNSHYNPLDKARYDALSDAAKDISEDYARIRDVKASDLPKYEKLSQVREIRKGLNEKLKAAVAAADEAYERAQTEWEDIPDEVYYNAYIAQKGAKGDKDRDGKTIALSASKNKKKAIDAAAKDLTVMQKRKLYEAFGVSEKVW